MGGAHSCWPGHASHRTPLVFLACSFVSYLGPFNKEFRELLITRDFYGSCVAMGIPVTKDLRVSTGSVALPRCCFVVPMQRPGSTLPQS